MEKRESVKKQYMSAAFLLIFIILLDLFVALNEHDLKIRGRQGDGSELEALSFVSMRHGAKWLFSSPSFAFIEIDLLCKTLVIQLECDRKPRVVISIDFYTSRP